MLDTIIKIIKGIPTLLTELSEAISIEIKPSTYREKTQVYYEDDFIIIYSTSRYHIKLENQYECMKCKNIEHISNKFCKHCGSKEGYLVIPKEKEDCSKLSYSTTYNKCKNCYKTVLTKWTSNTKAESLYNYCEHCGINLWEVE